MNKIWDLNPAAGGPIFKDRMWIYASVPALGHVQQRRRLVQGRGFHRVPVSTSCNADASGDCTTEQNLFPVWH